MIIKECIDYKVYVSYDVKHDTLILENDSDTTYMSFETAKKLSKFINNIIINKE